MTHALRYAHWYRHLRGFTVGVTLLVLFVMASPDAGRVVDPRGWQSRSSQEQFASCSRFLNSLGLEVSPWQVQEGLWTVAESYAAFRAPASRALQPLSEQLGVQQGWRMFSHPNPRPARVVLEVARAGGPFQPWYVARSDAHPWRARQFAHNRFRKILGRLAAKQKRDHLYQRFLEWSAQEIRREAPDVSSVRLSVSRWSVPPPGHAGGESRAAVEGQRTLPLPPR